MTLKEKIEEIKKKHKIMEAEIIERLPSPLEFREGVTEEEIVNFFDLIYG